MSGWGLDNAIEQDTSSQSGGTPGPQQHLRLPTLAELRLEKVPEGLKGPCRLRVATSDCLNKNFPHTGSLHFQNMDDAKASMDIVQWRAPGQDSTVPQTEEEHRAVAKHLVNAFKEMSVARDTEGNAYRKRLSPTHDSYYGDWAIEACAWDIIRMVKAIHTEGFKASIYDKTVIDAIGQTQQWTFGERIDWICMALKVSKANAVSFMKNEKIWTIIGAPHRLYNSTITNSVSNKHRGAWVITGRNADPDHQARTFKRQKSHHTPSSSIDVSVGTEEVEDTMVGGCAGAFESGQSDVTEAFQATQIVKTPESVQATQAIKTSANIEPARKQCQSRKRKYDITPMPDSYIARNQDMGPIRYQPFGLPARNNASSGSAPPLQQPSLWRSAEQLRDAQIIKDAQIAKDAQMTKLLFGELPKYDTQMARPMFGELSNRNEQVAKDAQMARLMFRESPKHDYEIRTDIAAADVTFKSSERKNVVKKAVAGKKRGRKNGAAATRRAAAVPQVYQAFPDIFAVRPQLQTQPRVYDADVVEGALLLISLRDPR